MRKEAEETVGVCCALAATTCMLWRPATRWPHTSLLVTPLRGCCRAPRTTGSSCLAGGRDAMRAQRTCRRGSSIAARHGVGSSAPLPDDARVTRAANACEAMNTGSQGQGVSTHARMQKQQTAARGGKQGAGSRVSHARQRFHGPAAGADRARRAHAQCACARARTPRTRAHAPHAPPAPATEVKRILPQASDAAVTSKTTIRPRLRRCGIWRRKSTCAPTSYEP